MDNHYCIIEVWVETGEINRVFGPANSDEADYFIQKATAYNINNIFQYLKYDLYGLKTLNDD